MMKVMKVLFCILLFESVSRVLIIFSDWNSNRFYHYSPGNPCFSLKFCHAPWNSNDFYFYSLEFSTYNLKGRLWISFGKRPFVYNILFTGFSRNYFYDWKTAFAKLYDCGSLWLRWWSHLKISSLVDVCFFIRKNIDAFQKYKR